MSEDTVVETPEVIEQTPADLIEANNRYDFVSDKYRADGRSEDDAMMEQAKAYPELSSKFGGFTGSPKDGFVSELSQELTEKGMTIDPESPILQRFGEIALEGNMSQEMYSNLLEIPAMIDAATEVLQKESLASEMELLGDKGSQRLTNIDNWVKANLDAENYSHYAEGSSTAAGVAALEAIISKALNAPIESTDVANDSGLSKMELDQFLHAKDPETGERLMNQAEYRAEYQRKAEALLGTGPRVENFG